MTEKKHQWELLTESEKDFIKPLEQIVAEITLRYKFVDGADSQAINDKMNDEFRSICTERNIDIKRAIVISTKLFNSPWYCYFLSDVETVNGEHRSVFSLCTSKTPDQNKPINPDKNPAFYQAVFSTNTDPDTAYPAILKALKLSAEYKYLQADHYETLATVAEVFTNQHSGILIPRTRGRRVKKLDVPLDKPNGQIWDALSKDTKDTEENEETNTVKQILLRIDTTSRKTKAKGKNNEPAIVMYSINFDELTDAKITKALEPYDKRVYIAVAALFNTGSEWMSIPQIYDAMGYKGAPGKFDKDKINASITKMSAAKIYLDNSQEVDAKYNYQLIHYDGALLQMERLTAIINGELIENAIHIFREPVMIAFARGRKQISTVDKNIYATPVSKTNANIRIEDYLLERILRARVGSGQRRILFTTIYENAKLDTSRKRQYAKTTIQKILDHYVKHNLIRQYTIDEEGIVFSFKPTKLIQKP